MNKREKIIEMALKKYTQPIKFVKKTLYYKGYTYDEITQILRDIEFESTNSRVKFVRNVECELERLINENINRESYEYITIELKKYIDQNYGHLEMTYNLVNSFIGNRYFQTINDMRAFKAICDGDFETYKLFAGDSREIFMYCVIRVLSLITQDSEVVKSLGEVLTDKYDTKMEEESTFNKVLKYEMGGKSGYLIKGYRDVMKDYDICFYNGIVEIIDSILKEHGYDSTIEVEESTEKDLDSKDVIETKTKEDIKSNEECSVVEIESIDDNKNNNQEESTIYDVLKIKANELISMISELEHDVQNKVNDIEISDLNKELEELRLENSRLKNELDILRVKAEGPSLKSFIQMVGGRSGNYQLSELYLIADDMIEDDGNSVGRFINILTMLESFGVSAYFGNRRYNEEFEIERRELAKKYMLEMPLRGDSEIVKVKLIKNGWMLDGQIIVLPLVEQIQ